MFSGHHVSGLPGCVAMRSDLNHEDFGLFALRFAKTIKMLLVPFDEFHFIFYTDLIVETKFFTVFVAVLAVAGIKARNVFVLLVLEYAAKVWTCRVVVLFATQFRVALFPIPRAMHRVFVAISFF